MATPFTSLSRARAARIAGLARAFTPAVRGRGDEYVDDVHVTIDDDGRIAGTVDGSAAEPYRIRMAPAADDRRVMLAACTCPAAERDPCKHLWAAVRLVAESAQWPRELELPQRLVMVDLDHSELAAIAGDGTALARREPDRPRASRPAAVIPRPAAGWRERFDPWPPARPEVARVTTVEYLVNASPLPETPQLRSRIVQDDTACTVVVVTTARGRDGATRRTFARIERGRLAAPDAELHDVLFGVQPMFDLGPHGATYHSYGVSDGTAVRISRPRIAEVIPRLASSGRLGWLPGRHDEALTALGWDGEPWSIAIRLAPIAGSDPPQVAAIGSLVRGDERVPIDRLAAIAGGGVAILGDRAIRIATDAPARWWRLLAGGLELPAAEVAAFLDEVARCDGLRLDVDAVGWAVVEPALVRRIIVEPRDRVRFTARATLSYTTAAAGAEGVPRERPIDPAGGGAAVPGERRVDPAAGGAGPVPRERRVDPAGGGAGPVPRERRVDPGGGGAVETDPGERRVVRRRFADERAAATSLLAVGGGLDRPWTVPGASLAELVETTAADGWEVWYDGRPLRPRAAWAMKVTSGIDWFDVSIDVADGSATADVPALLAALRGGRPYVVMSDGTHALIPGWLRARGAAVTSAPVIGEALRFRIAEATMVAALLDQVTSPQVDAGFARLRARLENFAGLAPRDAPPGFAATLRDYQRDGLAWLHFLRELGLGGCLADDMGLGKTIQVLALLESIRQTAPRRRPSLVVAPRSLVFHWIDEARRFAPALRAVEWHGASRDHRASQLAAADLIVTTYPTLRNDLERFAALELDTVVLDEAQAIKTASSATARAVRELRADHRLALTGTPVENRLDDLASIFEFLNPGLLGRAAALRGIAGGESDDREAEVERARALGKVLRPFLLRRTKQDVLTELPAKTEIVISCRLEGSERARYDELRGHYRRELLRKLQGGGPGASIMVLEALLRLRQAALHPGLLDRERIGDSSAKLDALIEHLRAAIASGHRALVFSQFTELLAIVRVRLDREQIAHQYLDGKTEDRRERVAAFQTGDAAVFLLSLKAGGTGLNLTAADHVFLLDPWWNPAAEAQAIDRVHRIGQARPVTAYRLVAEDTVEDKILGLQAHKRALFAGVFEEHSAASRLTAADLRALLD